MRLLARAAGVVGQLPIGLAVERLQQGAGVLEEGSAQAQFDGFEVADAVMGQGLADHVQEGGGCAELGVGDLRRLKLFFESGWASWARVSWSVTVT